MVARRWSGLALLMLGLLAALGACGGAVPPAAVPISPTVAVASGTAARATPPGTPMSSPIRPATPAASPSAAASPRTVGSPGAGGTPARTAYPLTIQDTAGRWVTLPRRPERIVSLAPSNTEALFALGLGDRVVGVDRSSDYPPAARDKPKIGTFSQPTIEEVVAQAPDLVLAANIHVRATVPALEARGLTVVVLNPADLPAVLGSITLVGQLTDSADAARRLRGEMEGRIAAVEARLRGVAPRPRAYVEITPKFVAAGPTSFIGDLVVRAGGSNIVDDRGTQYPALSAETIVARDPEVIVLTDVGGDVTVASVGERSGWAGISAVKNGRVVAIDPNLVNRAGPRVVEGLEQLARAFHPGAFR